MWDGVSAWVTQGNHTQSTVYKLSYTYNFGTAQINRIDANGFYHWIAYAEASNGTTASTINTDFVDADVQLLVQSVPTGYATTSYTPYKLSYQLATTVEQVVNAEGAINLHTGGNQIDVQEGVIVREKATPVYYANGNSYYINNNVVGQTSYFKNKSNNIVKIFKNGVEDKRWTIRKNQSTGIGGADALIAAVDYDSTAEYTVTYTLLDKYANTAANTDVTGTYEGNISTSLNHAIRRLGDVETIAAINVNAIADLYKRMKGLGG
jgi:hypothetical protein